MAGSARETAAPGSFHSLKLDCLSHAPEACCSRFVWSRILLSSCTSEVKWACLKGVMLTAAHPVYLELLWFGGVHSSLK